MKQAIKRIRDQALLIAQAHDMVFQESRRNSRKFGCFKNARNTLNIKNWR